MHSHDIPSVHIIDILIFCLQLQSLAWIAISIIAIVAYFCALNFRGMIASLGTITELVLFHMYFHGKLTKFLLLCSIYNTLSSLGTCSQSGLPDVDYATLDKLNLIRPPQVHICMWIYLALSVFWLISSITLLTSMLAKKPIGFVAK